MLFSVCANASSTCQRVEPHRAALRWPTLHGDVNLTRLNRRPCLVSVVALKALRVFRITSNLE